MSKNEQTVLNNEEKRDSQIATSESAHEISKDGAFVRQKNHFATPFGSGENELPVESNRYRLLWAGICPWAHRQVIALNLLGLTDVISIGEASPVRTEKGWEFSLDEGGVDPVLGIRYLPEIYEKTDPNYNGRATVPTVVDVKTGKVVNNDYFKLSNYWETVWKPFHKTNAPDLYPEELREEIDILNDIIFHEVNNGVYKAGFAQSQESYEKAYDTLFARLDYLEERLSKQRYLFGDKITDSDIRLYVTLARFDIAYYPVFRVNRNRIIDFPNLWAYARDLYQTPGFGDTTNFDAIKRGYHLGNHAENPYQILAKGPDLSIWNTPHGRETLTYSDAIFKNQYVIAVASDNKDINSFKDLLGKKTEVTSGTNYATALENYNKNHSDKPVTINYTDADLISILQRVESGQFDFQLIDAAMLKGYIEEHGLKLKTIQLSKEDSDLIGTPYSYLLIGKGADGEALSKDVNKALSEVISEGKVKAISEKYFKEDFTPKSN